MDQLYLILFLVSILRTLSSSALECGKVRIRSAMFDILQFHMTSALALQTTEELILAGKVATSVSTVLVEL